MYLRIHYISLNLQPLRTLTLFKLFLLPLSFPPNTSMHLDIDISKRVSIQSADSCKWDTILGQLRESPHLVTTTVDEVSIKLPSIQ